MSVGSIIDGGELLRPEKIGPFGSFPPSLLIRYFEYHEFLPFATGSPPASPNITGNVNRFAFLVTAPNTFASIMSLHSPAGNNRYTIILPAQQSQVFTFADLGCLICQPWWFFQTADDGGSVTEIIYKPTGCS
jgi:hypothetical protein